MMKEFEVARKLVDLEAEYFMVYPDDPECFGVAVKKGSKQRRLDLEEAQRIREEYGIE